MRYASRRHHRRSIRLPAYDYRSLGVYFVTVCTHQGQCLLGEVVNGEMRLNEWGKVASGCWQAIPDHFPHVELDAYVIMPNHVHGIIVITDRAGVPVGAPVGAQHAAPLPPQAPVPPQSPRTNVQPGSLGAVVRSFKAAATKDINELRKMAGVSIWQRNYYEHIVRNDDELCRIRQYIADNPAKWALDPENPARG